MDIDRTRSRWLLPALALAMLLPSLDTGIANVALPTLADAFGASFGQVRWIVLAYLIALTGLVVGAGRLGDRFGRRPLLLAGIALFTGASLISASAPSLAFLVASRALQGLGAACMIALSMALVMDAVPAGRVGRALGLLGSMSALGTTVGPSLGGLLIAGFGWRAIFLAPAFLGAAVLLLAYHAVPAVQRRDRGKEAGDPSLLMLARDPTLGAGLAMSMIVATVMMGTLIVGPFYLSQGLGLDAARVGLIMSAGPLAAVLTGFPAGRLVDRFGAGKITVIGLSGMAAGLAALPSAAAYFGAGGYVAALALVTVHYALFQTANNGAVMKHVRAESRGAVSGMLSFSRNLGLIAGASAMAAIFATVSSAWGVTAGMRTTFAVAALLVLAALAMATFHRAMLTGRGRSWQSGLA